MTRYKLTEFALAEQRLQNQIVKKNQIRWYQIIDMMVIKTSVPCGK